MTRGSALKERTLSAGHEELSGTQTAALTDPLLTKSGALAAWGEKRVRAEWRSEPNPCDRTLRTMS